MVAPHRGEHVGYIHMSQQANRSGIGTRMLRGLVALGIVSFAIATSHAQSSEARALLSYDGLEEVKSKKLDLLFVQPGATLTPYKKVWIDPIEVAFHKTWNRDRRNVSAKDRERIRRDIAATFHDILREELQRGGYEIVSAAGPDVLRVSAAIINLYITAPDTMSAVNSRTYVMSAGEMTLLAELHDSESGAILARVADRRSGRNSGFFEWATRASNAGEARRILRVWAGALRNGLDSAREA
jgi:hypothetical protein